MKQILGKIYLVLIVFAASVIYFNGCNYDQIKSKSTTGDLTIEVDEGLYPVVKKEADEFMRLNKEAKIIVVVKTSKEVIADLANGNIKTIISGRDFTKEESGVISANKTEVKKSKIALDGIGVIVNPNNPLRKINYSELKKIFTGENTDWANLEGDNKDVYKGNVKVFIARKNAAIHDIFKEKVLGGAEFSKYNTVCSTSTQMINEIKSNENAIGFISMSWITKFADTLDTSVKPLKVATVDSAGRVGDYVGLHQAYIADRSYPLVTEAFLMSTDFTMSLSVGFTSFVLAYDGQKIILNSGLVPVTQPVKIIQLN
jgi:phosphate transport system substrate-binding protein